MKRKRLLDATQMKPDWNQNDLQMIPTWALYELKTIPRWYQHVSEMNPKQHPDDIKNDP